MAVGAVAYGYFILHIGRYAVTNEESIFMTRLTAGLNAGRTEIPLSELTDFVWDMACVDSISKCEAVRTYISTGSSERWIGKLTEVGGSVGFSTQGRHPFVYLPWWRDDEALEYIRTMFFFQDDKLVGIVKITANALPLVTNKRVYLDSVKGQFGPDTKIFIREKRWPITSPDTFWILTLE